MAKTDQTPQGPLVLIGEGESFKDELCSMLERVQLFRDFSRDDIQTIAGYARAYEVKQGEIIFREGEKGQYMCLIVEGKIGVLKESDNRERKTIATIRPGKTMGEMSMLDELPHSATAVANEDVKLVMITRMNFEKLVDAHPALGVKILKKIARLMSLRLRQTTGILLDYLE
jgi:CRP-like cAMP-binding protein